MRLIDADKFIERCKEIMAEQWNQSAGPSSWARAYEDVIDEVEVQPTIDAVPVVRCEDCKWFSDVDDYCLCEGDDSPRLYTTSNGFCDKGKRKGE